MNWMKNRNGLFQVLLIAGLCAVFLLSGCTKKEEAAKEPVKIGAIFSVTGPASWLGKPEANTITMLAEKINNEGGIDGHPVEVIIKDSQASSEKASSFAKQLINEDKVIAILGPSTSGESNQIKKTCEDGKMILISCAASEKIVNPVASYVFKTPQKDSYAAIKIFQQMQKMGISKIGVLVSNKGFGKGGKEQLEKHAGDYNIEIAVSEVYDAGATDLTDLLTKLKAANVEAVVNWSIVAAQSIIPQNMKQLEMDVPLFQSHGFGNKKYVENAKGAAEGTIFPCGRLLVAETLPDDHPQKDVLVEYKTEYEKKFGDDVSTFGGHAYDAFMILVKAMEKAGVEDKEAIRTAIENTKGFVGTGGIFNLSAEDHNGLELDSFEMLTVKDGEFTVLE